jgi:hypothetical protein
MQIFETGFLAAQRHQLALACNRKENARLANCHKTARRTSVQSAAAPAIEPAIGHIKAEHRMGLCLEPCRRLPDGGGG